MIVETRLWPPIASNSIYAIIITMGFQLKATYIYGISWIALMVETNYIKVNDLLGVARYPKPVIEADLAVPATIVEQGIFPHINKVTCNAFAFLFSTSTTSITAHTHDHCYLIPNTYILKFCRHFPFLNNPDKVLSIYL